MGYHDTQQNGEPDPNEPSAWRWDAVLTCFFIDTVNGVFSSHGKDLTVVHAGEKYRTILVQGSVPSSALKVVASRPGSAIPLPNVHCDTYYLAPRWTIKGIWRYLFSG